MERTLLSLPEDLADALDRFGREQDPPREPSEIVQTALRAYLDDHGYVETDAIRFLTISPAEAGSGVTDVSLHHDRYFAG
jgi:metal-responsive CopG/Arc/MetJ family transcriptional regulator